MPPEGIIGLYNLFMIMVFFCEGENAGESQVCSLESGGN